MVNNIKSSSGCIMNNAGGNNPSCPITIIHRYLWVYVKEIVVLTYKIFKVNEWYWLESL